MDVEDKYLGGSGVVTTLNYSIYEFTAVKLQTNSI